jgi:tRNA pseudouridine13 synthase
MTEHPAGHGEPVLRARMRTKAADFRVDELDSFDPSGEGEHWLIRLEKTGANTAWVANQLARWAGIAPMGVGYAGLKDRHAITTQRFSLHLPKRQAPDLQTLAIEGVRCVEAHWHSRKLGRGALAGNRFAIRLREVVGDRDAIETRLGLMARQGVPNYFGSQRFGRDGDNIAAAKRMFAGARVRREQRSILLSAARSGLFNAVLAERIRQGNWNRGLHGEVWILDGRGSIFGPEPAESRAELDERCKRGEIHPTGPLWGRGTLRCDAGCAELESSIANSEWAEVCAGLQQAGLNQERRALRLMPRELEWEWDATGDLQLRFSLPSGCYATSVLNALGDIEDVSSSRPVTSESDEGQGS